MFGRIIEDSNRLIGLHDTEANPHIFKTAHGLPTPVWRASHEDCACHTSCCGILAKAREACVDSAGFRTVAIHILIYNGVPILR
jgi:hypothetical protein